MKTRQCFEKWHNLELSGRHIAPNAWTGSSSGKRVGVELQRAWLQDRVKFDLGYCLGVEGVELASRMSSSVSVDFVIGRLHISQILQIALIHIILLDSCIFWALKVLSGQAACLVLTKGSGRESQVLGCKAERSNRDLMLCSAWAAAEPSGN